MSEERICNENEFNWDSWEDQEKMALEQEVYDLRKEKKGKKKKERKILVYEERKQHLCSKCQQKPTIKRYNVQSFYKKKTKMWLCFWCWQSMKNEGIEVIET